MVGPVALFIGLGDPTQYRDFSIHWFGAPDDQSRGRNTPFQFMTRKSSASHIDDDRIGIHVFWILGVVYELSPEGQETWAFQFAYDCNQLGCFGRGRSFFLRRNRFMVVYFYRRVYPPHLYSSHSSESSLCEINHCRAGMASPSSPGSGFPECSSLGADWAGIKFRPSPFFPCFYRSIGVDLYRLYLAGGYRQIRHGVA